MKILSIGNSFSQDAQRYLHELAIFNGEDLYTVNLYIGGCSLERHYNNLTDDSSAYEMEVNGKTTSKFISIKEAVLSDDFDVITLQQASYASVDFSTFTPYIEGLASFIKKVKPNAKIYIHQTWAYEDNCEKLKALNAFSSADEMFNAVKSSYQKAFDLIGADGIILSGQAMLNAVKSDIKVIHRDTFHAKLGVGRYLLALVWYKTLTGKSIDDDQFNDFDEPVLDKERKICIKIVNDLVK